MLCAGLNVALGPLWGLFKLIVLQLEVVIIKVEGCMTDIVLLWEQIALCVCASVFVCVRYCPHLTLYIMS